MINLDSFKIEAPVSVLKRYNSNSPDIQILQGDRYCRGEMLDSRDTVNGIAPGWSYFENNKTKQTIIFGGSAKILGDDYFKGINQDTIGQVFDQVNKAGFSFLEVDVPSIIEQGRFLSVDTTTNLHVSHSPLQYLEALNMYRVNYRYKTDFSNTRKNQGIVFAGRQTSFKERVILYAKYIELTNKPENKPFLATIKNPAKLIKESEHIIRCEQNNVQLRKIRERLNIQDTGIVEVLTSKANPNYFVMNKVIRGGGQLTLFNELEEFKSFHQLEKRKGQESIIRECLYDIHLVREIMRHFYSEGTNMRRQLKEYKDLIVALQEKETFSQEGTANELIDEVMELLKAS